VLLKLRNLTIPSKDTTYVKQNAFPRHERWPPQRHPRIYFPLQPVIERGDMNSIERMRAAAAWWIAASKGDIKIAVVLGANRTKPELVLEEWGAARHDKGNQDYGDNDI